MSTKRDSPFSQLEALREHLPKGMQQNVAVPYPGPKRAIVRLEKKHRRGKEVTVVEKLDLKPAELEQWYADHVIGGPFAFVLPAQGYGDFARAIRRKFLVEISQALGAWPVSARSDLCRFCID